MTDPNNLEGARTPEELAENFRELNRIAPTTADKFRLMMGQTNESMNDLPANLPPLPYYTQTTSGDLSGHYIEAVRDEPASGDLPPPVDPAIILERIRAKEPPLEPAAKPSSR